jgi:hypothetical protein
MKDFKKRIWILLTLFLMTGVGLLLFWNGKKQTHIDESLARTFTEEMRAQSATTPSPKEGRPTPQKTVSLNRTIQDWVSCIQGKNCTDVESPENPNSVFSDPTQRAELQGLSLALRDLRKRTCSAQFVPKEWENFALDPVLNVANSTGQEELIAAVRCRTELKELRWKIVESLWRFEGKNILELIKWIMADFPDEAFRLQEAVLSFVSLEVRPSKDQLSAVLAGVVQLNLKAEDIENFVKGNCPSSNDARFWKKEYQVRAERLLRSAGISRPVSAYCP